MSINERVFRVTRSPLSLRLPLVLLLVGSISTCPIAAQQFLNGDFSNGTDHWGTSHGVSPEVNTASVYGSVAGDNNHVTEVDGNGGGNNTRRGLCQTVTGLQEGAIYSVGFVATRRISGSTPATVHGEVWINGEMVSAMSRNNTTFALTAHTVYFKAEATSVHFELRPPPAATNTYGLIVDNVVLTLVSALPVELLHFNATGRADRVDLEWATATERDNDHFLLERSNDLREWREIGSVPGAGNSSARLDYAWTDRAPFVGANFYRLRQVDHDGTESLSSTVVAHLQTVNGIQAWPVPADQRLFLDLGQDASVLRVVVVDPQGRTLLLPWSQDQQRVTLGVEGLPPGPYVVRCLQDRWQAVRFVKG